MVRTQALAGVIAALLAASCSRPAQVVVGSKNFTEQLILGEILAQQLERRGMTVERKLDLGGTLLAHQALATGAIDLYPEYTGTALTAVLKAEPSADAAAVFARVAEQYRRRWGLEWLPALGFDDTFAITVRGETARSEHLVSLSDAARRTTPWRLGAGYEFLQRRDGLPGLVKTYGLRLGGTPVSMDLGLLYKALEQRQVEMVAGNSTDAQLAVLDVMVLRDDKGYFPPYQCAVVVRQAALASDRRLGPALRELSGAIPDETMRKLNHAVEGEHRPVREVAAQFLNSMHR
jgi:osmoprotectant transport system substrate-binding protein